MTRRATIDGAELRVGMYVVAIDAPWWHHPFWRSSFPIDSPDTLARVREVADRVTIDLDRGVAPARRSGEAMTDGRPPRDPLLQRRHDDPPRSSLAMLREPDPDEEVRRAAETVRRSRTAVTRMFREARLGGAIHPEQVMPLVEEISASVTRNASAMLKVTRLKRKNEYTYLHSVAVCALMINLARRLRIDEALVPAIGMAGLLHDIGKMAVPGAVLDKPGPLDEAELAQLRDHPRAGHAMLAPVPEMSPIVLDVCLHHHEKVDGTGYPHGLAGEALSLHARMGAICDVYDAVTSNRAYKAAWEPADALARMQTWEGHFDPDILEAFIRSVGIYPVGTLVRLRSNRLGVVIEGDRRDPGRPLVRAFGDALANCFIRCEDVRIGETLACDQIVGTIRGGDRFGAAWPALLDAVSRAPRSVAELDNIERETRAAA